MSQTITLELPDRFFQPLQRAAQATKQPIEDILLNALQTSLPPLDGLSEKFVKNLTLLETLDDKKLRQVLRERVATNIHTEISALLEKKKAKILTEFEVKTLEELQSKADLVMLRKARAAVLLRFRGLRLPTLAELE